MENSEQEHELIDDQMKNQLYIESPAGVVSEKLPEKHDDSELLKLRRYWTSPEEEAFFEIWGRENWRITRHGKNTIHFANWSRELKERWNFDIKPEEVQAKVNQTRSKYRQVLKQHENDRSAIRWKKFEVVEQILNNRYRPADAEPLPPELERRLLSGSAFALPKNSTNAPETNQHQHTSSSPVSTDNGGSGTVSAEEVEVNIKPETNLSTDISSLPASGHTNCNSEFSSENIDNDHSVGYQEEESLNQIDVKEERFEDEEFQSVIEQNEQQKQQQQLTEQQHSEPTQQTPRLPVMVANSSWEQQLQVHIQQNQLNKLPPERRKTLARTGQTSVILHSPQQQQQQVVQHIQKQNVVRIPLIPPIPQSNIVCNNQPGVLQRAPVVAHIATTPTPIINNGSTVPIPPSVGNNNLLQQHNVGNNVAINNDLNNFVNTSTTNSNAFGNIVNSNLSPNNMGNNVANSNVASKTNVVNRVTTPRLSQVRKRSIPTNNLNTNNITSIIYAVSTANTATTVSSAVKNNNTASYNISNNGGPALTVGTSSTYDPNSLESIFVDEVRKKNLILAEQNEISRKRLILEERKVSLMEKFFPNCLQLQAEILQKLNKQ